MTCTTEHKKVYAGVTTTEQITRDDGGMKLCHGRRWICEECGTEGFEENPPPNHGAYSRILHKKLGGGFKEKPNA